MGTGSVHYCHGLLDVAFVFSAPGSIEKLAVAPTSGVTGDHFEIVLKRLNHAYPDIFRSTHRYDYRITNAFTEPLARTLGHDRTEAGSAHIKTASNRNRILGELDGMRLVVLCGRKAGLLAPELGGFALVKTGHLSQNGLNSTWPTRVLGPDAHRLSSEERRHLRLAAWECDVIAQVGALVQAGRL